MISFKSFINAIQGAIAGAAEALMDTNVSLLDKYFTEVTQPISEGSEKQKSNLVPKTVILSYPHLTANGTVENLDIAVPLITLVPITMSKLDQVTLSANFEMEVVNEELLLRFTKEKSPALFRKKSKMSWGKIEMTFSPQQTTEAFKLLIQGYEDTLRRQLP
jgi:hypothetical protein